MGADEVGDQVEEEAWRCSAKNVARYTLQTAHQQSWMHQLGQILHQEGDEDDCHYSRCIPSFCDQAWSDHPYHDLNKQQHVCFGLNLQASRVQPSLTASLNPLLEENAPEVLEG